MSIHSSCATLRDLCAGDHVCHVYGDDEELLAPLASFVAEGILHNERTRVICRLELSGAIRKYLGESGLDVGSLLRESRLGIHDLDEAFEIAGGEDFEDIADVLRSQARLAADDGFAGLRVFADMSGVRRRMNSEAALLRVEACLGDVLRDENILHVCAYDRREMAASLLTDVLATHPVLSVGGQVFSNLYHRPPADFLAGEPGAARLRHYIENVAERAGAHRLMLYHFSLEKALADFSRLLLASPEPDFTKALGIFARAVGASRAYIFLLRDGAKRMDKVYQWCDADTPSNQAALQNMRCEDYPWWTNGLDGGGIIINNLESLPPDAALLRETLVREGICSLAAVPIRCDDGGLSGFLGFDDMRRARRWSHEEIRLLGVASEMIGSWLRRTRGEELYRNVVAAAEDIVFTLDFGGVVESANSAFETITGWALADWLGRNAMEIIHEEDLPSAMKALELAAAGRKSSRLRTRVLCRSGEYRLLETTLAPLVTAGRVTGISGISRDITERVRIEEALETSQHDYEAIFNAVNDAVTVHAIEDGAIVDANETACRLFGRSLEELKRLRVADLSLDEPPYTQADAERLVTEAADKGPQLFEWLCRHSSGRLFWVEVSLKRTSIGGRDYVLAVVRDISERKRAEEALRESEANYRAIFDTINDAIFVHDMATGGVVDVNRKMCEMFECVRADVIGLTAAKFSKGESPYAVEDALKWLQKAVSEGPQLFEWMAKSAKGRLFWTEVNLRCAQIGGEKRILAVVRDIDKRKKLELQLMHAQKIEALGRVVGGVAHDFNNVLAAIAGYAELAGSRLDPQSETLGEVDAIKNIALNAGLLTRQLLTFSRKKPVEPRNVNLNDVINDISLMLKPVIGQNIEMTTLLCDRIGPIKADPGALAQVLVNLAINARDAMPEGGSLTIETADVPAGSQQSRARPGLDGRRWAKLVVRDTGCGMDTDTLAHVFEPFFTTKEAGAGTGLGLSTVFAIVKQSGGFIFFDTAPGAGAACSIYLPVASGVVAAEKVERHTSQGTGATILLADDNDTLRDFAADVLATKGYKVLTARDGQAALRLCRDEGAQVDLLITDLIMPKMDGRSLADELSRIEPGMKVLFTSGYAGVLSGEDGALPADVEILEKPFAVDALTDRVARLVGR